jgi:hypothetical protein
MTTVKRNNPFRGYNFSIMNGAPDRRKMTIVLMNEARQPVMRWHAENAWTNKIEGPSFNAAGNEVAMESVELNNEGVRLLPRKIKGPSLNAASGDIPIESVELDNEGLTHNM